MNSLAFSPVTQEINQFLNEKSIPRPLSPPPIRQYLFAKALPIFSSRKNASYEASLQMFREHIKKNGLKEEGVRQIGFHLMTQPLLIPGAAVMARHLPAKSDPSFAKQVFEDQKAIFTSLRFGDFEGRLHRNISKLKAILNFFDPHIRGNMPFLAGHRFLNNKKVAVLRHGSPTVENGPNGVEVAGEYLAFLENCKVNKQKVLYNCLLNPSSRDERLRITKIGELAQKYPNTFHFIRLPLDGALHKIDQYSTLEDYILHVQKDLEASLFHPLAANGSFLFSSDVRQVVAQEYKNILRFTKYWIKKASLKDLKDEKRAFMILFCTLLKSQIISTLSIDYYNNTCKDAIDRGAVHLGADLLWDDLLGGKEMQKENPFLLRSIIAWPAFLARTRPILSKRLVWLQSFARFVEKADPYQKQIASLQKEMLQIQVDKSPKLDTRNWTNLEIK